ncbi:STAS domain-containing protein [Streptomyces sp. NPDC040750]|uniref:STAS domain-containing protein n=1 Tax=Streptomyces sp. NPDC040750 TaxID=3154491 RepID=UPI0033C07CBA
MTQQVHHHPRPVRHHRRHADVDLLTATPLTLTSGRHPDGALRLTVSGEIDMSNSGSLTEALDARAGTLVRDLTEVEYLDSAGLSVLFAHADLLQLIVTPCWSPS